MKALACALLGAAGFSVSLGLGTLWPLAWLAPVALLWLAFSSPGWRQPFAAAFAAYALGYASVLKAYAGVMPWAILVLQFAVLGILFALAVGGARLVYRRLGAAAGIAAFACLWAAGDFLLAFNTAGGSVSTPAASQVDAFYLAQSASLVGFPGITFLLGLVAAALAAALIARRPAFAVLALTIFALNAGFGAWRSSRPAAETIRVALIGSDDGTGRVGSADEASARAAIAAYARQVEALAAKDVALVVLPENLARLAPDWRDAALAPLVRAAAAQDVLVVAGFNTTRDGQFANVAVLAGDGGSAIAYAKRRLVVGLETDAYAPGKAPFARDGIGIEICKDMDYPRMIRADTAELSPRIWAVPAWDFTADGWSHGRVAVLRSIENAVPMARAAREGRLTLNDRYGRLIADAPTGSGFTTVIGEVPLASAGERTLYTRIGDAFAWACLALGLALVAAAALRGGRSARGFPTRPNPV